MQLGEEGLECHYKSGVESLLSSLEWCDLEDVGQKSVVLDMVFGLAGRVDRPLHRWRSGSVEVLRARSVFRRATYRRGGASTDVQ